MELTSNFLSSNFKLVMANLCRCMVKGVLGSEFPRSSVGYQKDLTALDQLKIKVSVGHAGPSHHPAFLLTDSAFILMEKLKLDFHLKRWLTATWKTFLAWADTSCHPSTTSRLRVRFLRTASSTRVLEALALTDVMTVPLQITRSISAKLALYTSPLGKKRSRRNSFWTVLWWWAS